jgi:hypothetical protein
VTIIIILVFLLVAAAFVTMAFVIKFPHFNFMYFGWNYESMPVSYYSILTAISLADCVAVLIFRVSRQTV